MIKRLISVGILIVILLSLCSFVTAEESTIKVTYKEANLYKSNVFYVQEYITQLTKVETLKGEEFKEVMLTEKQLSHEWPSVKWACEIGDVQIEKGKMYKFDKLENYQVKIKKGNQVLATKEGTLGLGKNQVLIEIEKSQYRFTIETKAQDTEKIDTKKQEWEKVEKSMLQWKTELKVGKKFAKDTMIIGQVKETPDKWAMGNVMYYMGKQPSKLYITDNRDLIVGDNKLSTSIIPYQCGKVRCWFKWEFILNVATPTPPTTTTTTITPTTPPTTITPTTPPTTITPTTPPTTITPTQGTEEDQLPKTGESNPMFYVAIGLIIVGIGAVVFVKKGIFS